ncbi:hypothetical protein SAY86_027086 [Trapa natans]|uniref:Transmembrane protein n=1 Tax=Trapa natans TaxID=22666 RepID=A0AAN7KT36_TRANT|nr:hypothetical protein SAY86_027086 [Trapa natans]
MDSKYKYSCMEKTSVGASRNKTRQKGDTPRKQNGHESDALLQIQPSVFRAPLPPHLLLSSNLRVRRHRLPSPQFPESARQWKRMCSAYNVDGGSMVPLGQWPKGRLLADNVGGGFMVPWEQWPKGRLLADDSAGNSSFILAAHRTRRKDPLNGNALYTGGWNISDKHYWASVSFTAAPFFVIAIAWFILFGISLIFICLWYCCWRREPYGYSRTAYALSLSLLIFFTVIAIAGCIVLYTGQGKLHRSTSDALDYVAMQVKTTAGNLTALSGYLASAKNVRVESALLSPDFQTKIDIVNAKLNSTASALSSKTSQNSEKIKYSLDASRLALIILAAVMLFLAFLGFLFSVLGLQCLVYTLVIVGWFLVAGTFILCGVFLLIHNVIADACVSMEEWVQNPSAHTALDDIIPCLEHSVTEEFLLQTKAATYQLVNVVNGVFTNVSNQNFPPEARPFYYNQSGPPVPSLCSPFNIDLTDRQCVPGEVDFDNASQVWKSYTCEVSSAGICTTTGRLTPDLYHQATASVNVSFGMFHYGPFLVDLGDCTFVRRTFTTIGSDHCPGLRKYTKWVYIGLVIASAAVLLSLILWVIYARERRHRVSTRQRMSM